MERERLGVYLCRNHCQPIGRNDGGFEENSLVFQIVFVVKRVISELTASVADIDLGKKCPCEVGCPHLRRSEPPSSAKRGKREPSLSLQRGQNVFTLSNY